MHESVYIVHHVHAEDGRAEDVKLIGVYSTKDAARNAVQRAGMQPSFRRFPRGFKITKYPLDKDQWSEGFVTTANGSSGTSR